MKRILILLFAIFSLSNISAQGYLQPIDSISYFSGEVSLWHMEALSNGDLLYNRYHRGLEESTSYIVQSEDDQIVESELDLANTKIIQPMEDGSFIIVNERGHNFGTPVLTVSRYSEAYELIWSTDLGQVLGGGESEFKGAFLLDDGLLIYGGDMDGAVIYRVDFNGELVWDYFISDSPAFRSFDFNFKEIPDYAVPTDKEEFIFITGDRELKIDIDGNELSNKPFIPFEEFELDYIPSSTDSTDFSYIKILVSDKDIFVLVNHRAYKQTSENSWFHLHNETYVVKFDYETHEIIWKKQVRVGGTGTTLRILPNGRLLYISSSNSENGSIIEFDSSDGAEIVDTSFNFDSPYKTIFPNTFFAADYIQFLGTHYDPDVSKHTYLVTYKADYDYNVYDYNEIVIPRKAQYGSGRKIVRRLASGELTGVLVINKEQSLKDLFVFRTDTVGRIFTNEVSGTVIGDLNEDCVHDSEDVSLANRELIARGEDFYYWTETNDNGEYSFQMDTGVYEISILSANDYWLNCDTASISFDTYFDTTSLDVLTRSIIPCSFIELDIEVSRLRRCFTNKVVVQYCNQGTIPEPNTMVRLHLDEDLDLINTDLPIDNISNDSLYFDIGLLGVGECGSFNLYVEPNCDNTVLGQEHCLDAHVYPDTLCLPQDSLWSGANVVVSSLCLGDSTLFTISNTGTATTKEDLTYVIIVDDIIVSRHDSFTLASGASIEHVVHEPGSNVALIADQEPNHPQGSQVGASNSCSGTDFDFASLFNQFDNDPFTDILCMNNTGSFDPNDKAAIPVGIGLEHDIAAEQKLDYKIRFQNTGTDTAFTVVIRDTISEHLDMESFEEGVGSHNYTLSIEEENILVFTFDNILLPDSTVNWTESNGFVTYSISPVEGVLPGTVIENGAAIYFDFNEPVITNVVFHTIAKPVVYSIEEISICASETYQSVNFDSDTLLSDYFPNVYQDSFALTRLIVLPVDSVMEINTIEYGTVVNGVEITEDFSIQEIYTNSFGCDSILIQNYVVQNSTSTSLLDESHWEVYPNPTSSKLHIKTNQSFNDVNYRVRIMNIVGTTVYSSNNIIRPNEVLVVSIEDLPAGTYLLSVDSANGIFTEKVVVNP